MYYHNENFFNEAEELIYDFLTYRRLKNKKKYNSKFKVLPFAMQSLIDGIDYDEDNYCACENMKKSDLNNKIENIIDQILNEYEYDGSPIFEEDIDSETLGQIIQKIIDMAINKIDELKNIKNEMQTQNFGITPYRLLKSLIEAMLINNIFHKRKKRRDDFNKFMRY